MRKGFVIHMWQAVVLLSLGFLTVACDEAVMQGLSEREANRVVAVLARHDLQATKQVRKKAWTVMIASSRLAQAIDVLEKERVFKDETKSGKKSAMLPTSRDERLREGERDLENSLGATIERLPEVREARVHLLMLSHSRLDSYLHSQERSASVLCVVLRSDAQLEDNIRQIVSGAAGIDRSRISVVMSVASDVGVAVGQQASLSPNGLDEGAATGQLNRVVARDLEFGISKAYVLVATVLCILGVAIIFNFRRRKPRLAARKESRLMPM